MLLQHEASQKKEQQKNPNKWVRKSFAGKRLRVTGGFVALRLFRRRCRGYYLQGGGLTVEILPEMFRFRKAAIGAKELIYMYIKSLMPDGEPCSSLLMFANVFHILAPDQLTSGSKSFNAVFFSSFPHITIKVFVKKAACEMSENIAVNIVFLIFSFRNHLTESC